MIVIQKIVHYEQSNREIYKGYDIKYRMGGAILIAKMINKIKKDNIKLIQYEESEIKKGNRN